VLVDTGHASGPSLCLTTGAGVTSPLNRGGAGENLLAAFNPPGGPAEQRRTDTDPRGGSRRGLRGCWSCSARALTTDVTPSDRPGRFCALLSIRHSNGPIFLGFCRYYYFGIRGAKMGRENPEFWRLQAEDAKKASKPEIARQYERIAKIIEERLNDLDKRAPAASDLRKLSMRKKQPGLKSA
jgi:hypothetical protein